MYNRYIYTYINQERKYIKFLNFFLFVCFIKQTYTIYLRKKKLLKILFSTSVWMLENVSFDKHVIQMESQKAILFHISRCLEVDPDKDKNLSGKIRWNKNTCKYPALALKPGHDFKQNLPGIICDDHHLCTALALRKLFAFNCNQLNSHKTPVRLVCMSLFYR